MCLTCGERAERIVLPCSDLICELAKWVNRKWPCNKNGPGAETEEAFLIICREVLCEKVTRCVCALMVQVRETSRFSIWKPKTWNLGGTASKGQEEIKRDFRCVCVCSRQPFLLVLCVWRAMK